jgi:hypothetical protein
MLTGIGRADARIPSIPVSCPTIGEPPRSSLTRWLMRSAWGHERGLFAQHIDATERLRVVIPPGELLGQVWSPDQKQHACLMRQASGLSVQVVPAFTGRATPLTTVALPETVRNARLIRWVGPNVYLEAQETGASAVLRRSAHFVRRGQGG